MATLLPQSISKNPHITAFEIAFAEKLAALDVGAVLLYLTEIVAESALDTLLDQWGVNAPGFNMNTTPVATKRKLLREAGLLNKRRGTIWALRYIFDANGMEAIHVAEADELNVRRYFNGTWFFNGMIPFGFQWLWAEYGIVIYTDEMTATMTDALMDTMTAGLLAYTPARCHLVGITHTVRMPDEIGITDSLAITFI